MKKAVIALAAVAIALTTPVAFASRDELQNIQLRKFIEAKRAAQVVQRQETGAMESRWWHPKLGLIRGA